MSYYEHTGFPICALNLNTCAPLVKARYGKSYDWRDIDSITFCNGQGDDDQAFAFMEPYVSDPDFYPIIGYCNSSNCMYGNETYRPTPFPTTTQTTTTSSTTMTPQLGGPEDDHTKVFMPFIYALAVSLLLAVCVIVYRRVRMRGSRYDVLPGMSVGKMLQGMPWNPMEAKLAYPQPSQNTLSNWSSSTGLVDEVSTQCAYFQYVKKLVKLLHFDEDPGFNLATSLNFDEHTKCFCDVCFNQRNDKLELELSDGLMQSQPQGFVRFGYTVGVSHAKVMKAFRKWEVMYHGTTIKHLPKILKTSRLVRPNTRTAADPHEPVTARDNHIQDEVLMTNAETGKEELVNPKENIYFSKSFAYSQLQEYASSATIAGSDHTLQVVLQLHVLPGSYKTGQNTTIHKNKIDPQVDNNSIEAYSDDSIAASQIITGVCFRIASRDSGAVSTAAP